MYLGIDLGTSSIKLVLFDEDQNIIAQSSQPLTVSQPHPLWSEQDPHAWWRATCDGVKDLRAQCGEAFSRLKAIGLSGQQHGATLLDKHGDVLRPAILWNDGRSDKQSQQLMSRVHGCTQIVGSLIMAGFTAPKILWVAEHEPAIFAKLARVLLPKDYLRFRMTDCYGTDLSDASGTAWLDIGKRRWSPEMLSATGLDVSYMPELFDGSDATFKVSSEIADAWGISKDVIVAGGGGDNPAAAISANVIKEGSAFLSLGTSGVYFVASDAYRPSPESGIHTFCHCLPKKWHHMTVHLSSASCMSWLASIVNADAKELLREAEANFSDKHSVLFLPYLSGERTPHNNPHAQGVFFGLTTTTQRHDLTRAVLEGVAFAFAQGQTAMQEAGIPIHEVSVVGGGSQSLFWGKILASALQRPLIYRKNREVSAALGAARLAWLAKNPCDPETAFTSPPVETVIEPVPALVDAYAKKQEIFTKLYQNVEPLFETTLS